MTANGNNIFMTRGDDASFLVYRTTEDGTHLPFEDGDTVRFTLRKKAKKNSLDTDFLVQKVITEFDNGYAEIKLTPRDTKDLKVQRYVYDCELTDKNGLINTFIKPATFSLGEEVT